MIMVVVVGGRAWRWMHILARPWFDADARLVFAFLILVDYQHLFVLLSSGGGGDDDESWAQIHAD